MEIDFLRVPRDTQKDQAPTIRISKHIPPPNANPARFVTPATTIDDKTKFKFKQAQEVAATQKTQHILTRTPHLRPMTL